MHIRAPTQVLKTSKATLSRKLLLGFAGASAAVVVGTAGIAAANPAQHPTQFPTSKADCVNWKTFGFKNRGQCVDWWEHHGAGHGYGNGNNNVVNTDVNLDVSGNHNIISIVLHYILG